MIFLRAIVFIFSLNCLVYWVGQNVCSILGIKMLFGVFSLNSLKIVFISLHTFLKFYLLILILKVEKMSNIFILFFFILRIVKI